MPTKPYAGTQSVRRAIALLKMFSDERHEWGLSELAREVGLNKTTAYRLLTALQSEGMVARNPLTEGWRLGPEAITLGALALRSNDLVSAARPELEALVRETGETASIEVLVGNDVLILDGVEGPSLVGASSEVGTRWPAHATSTGKVLLAAERAGGGKVPGGPNGGPGRSKNRRQLRKLTPRTITDPDRLDRELERVAERGWATAVEELETGYVAVGAPIRDHEGRAVAAISIGGPAARLTAGRIPELAKLVFRTADRISRRLGGRSARR
ncbi:MAG TPA: IclR family transcriptional regulator [Gemmatimonadota bacterium]|nr:IclR family transcriptional regulator [Gemmatimonadota bacterium]